mmetsp:Transcript_19368/g.56858  ORF Transcript_19368/g.56858 Transcript_19368/m.56858 type:complete len:178 (+) Transcript_19368:253-786(+)
MEQEPYVWLDLVSGKHYVCDRLTGDKIACTAKGKPLPKFKPGVSGVVKEKVPSSASAVANDPPSPRPPPFDDDEARSSRTQTKGRFGIIPPTEAELCMRERGRLRLMYPEREALAEARDQAFRAKVEESHRNMRAADTNPGLSAAARAPPKPQRKTKALKSLGGDRSRFTANMIYRP